MRRKIILLVMTLTILMGANCFLQSHCQIPCGIYDDETRFALMLEHANTIEKSMKEIKKLKKVINPDYNQLVRWINNKDEHADKLSKIITYYFMAQRVKPVEKSKKYIRKIKLLHEVLVLSMKTKQTTNINYCVELRNKIADFKKIYMKK